MGVKEEGAEVEEGVEKERTVKTGWGRRGWE